MAEITLGELAERIGAELTGEPSAVVRGVGTLEGARADEVTFLANARYEKHMAATQAAAVIVAADYAGKGTALLRCEDPYFAFRETMVMFHGFREAPFREISESAQIHPSATIGVDANIAAGATICSNVVIGARATVYPGVFVGPDCRIGDDVTLYPNVVIYDGCVLGHRVTIHAGSSIGHDGFGYATWRGRHEKIPQAGWVELGDDVEIGACCTIDRATIGPTVIGAGTKFSNLVAIGHGTKLGEHCLVVAQTGLAGSVKTGDYCVFGGQVGVVGHVEIAGGVRLGAQSGVHNSISGPGEYWGAPAMPLADARRVRMTYTRLPQMRSAIKKLTDEVKELKRRIEGLDGGDEAAP